MMVSRRLLLPAVVAVVVAVGGAASLLGWTVGGMDETDLAGTDTNPGTSGIGAAERARGGGTSSAADRLDDFLAATDPESTQPDETTHLGQHVGQVAAGTTLHAGDAIVSPNGEFRLTQRADGDLVLLDRADRGRWSTQTEGDPGAYSVFGVNGNLVVYGSDDQPLWHSATDGRGATLAVRDDAVVVIRDASGKEIWNSTRQRSRLYPGQGLRAGQSRTSPNGKYTLLQQDDGNLVVRNSAGEAVWSSQTGGNPGAYSLLGTDGNWGVYRADGTSLWHSGTVGMPGAFVQVESNGNAVVVGEGGRAVWGTRSHGVTLLTPGQILHTGQSRQSPNGKVRLALHRDGNLILQTTSGDVLWTSDTKGNPGAYLWMQWDGNLVLFDRNNKVLWHSNTHGNQSAFLSVQDDGNLVIYDPKSGRALWYTGTSVT